MKETTHEYAAQIEADAFVNTLAQTLSAANAYLTFMLSEAGLGGLVPSHGEILMHLFANEKMTMQDLANAIARDPSTITALVRKLADNGYVDTCKSAEDKRITEVFLTSKGRRMQSSFEEISKKLRDTQMKGIDPEAFDLTCQTIDSIRQNFVNELEEDKGSSNDKKN